MLTYYQVETVAYLGDGEVYCPECVDDQDLGRAKNDAAVSRYGAESDWACGLSCGQCGAEIVDYAHDWLAEGETCDECEFGKEYA